MAADRLTLVRECIHTARCMSRMARVMSPPTPALIEARREWMRRARTWRDHYEREIALNAAFLRDHPELCRRAGIKVA